MNYRPATIEDVNFILSSWLQSFKEDLDFKLPKFKYFYWSEPLIKLIITKSHTVLAVDPEDPEHIIGYVVYTPTNDAIIVNWVYVKVAFRQHGTAKALLNTVNPNKLPLIASFTTWIQRKLANNIPHTFSKGALEKVLFNG